MQGNIELYIGCFWEGVGGSIFSFIVFFLFHSNQKLVEIRKNIFSLELP